MTLDYLEYTIRKEYEENYRLIKEITLSEEDYNELSSYILPMIIPSDFSTTTNTEFVLPSEFTYYSLFGPVKIIKIPDPVAIKYVEEL